MRNWRLLFSGVLIVLLSLQDGTRLWAQGAKNNTSDIENSYYGLKWGCSPQDLKAKYPDAYANGKNNVGDDVYYLDGNDNTRIFFFAENKMYSARIVYEDVSTSKGEVIINKLIENYGKFDESSDGTRDGNEYFILYRYYSNITIYVELITYYNNYGRISGNSLMITYSNNKMEKEASDKRQQKMKEELEL